MKFITACDEGDARSANFKFDGGFCPQESSALWK